MKNSGCVFVGDELQKTRKLKQNAKIYTSLTVKHCLLASLSCLKGFDEYMNLVLDDAEEVHMKTKNRKPLGNITTVTF